jgi:hypothetical protein
LLVSMENRLQPQVKHKATCLAVKKPNESMKIELSTSTVTFDSLSLSPNEVRKFDWGLQVSHLISSLSFLPNKEWELWRCVLLSNGTYKTLKFWQVLFLGMTKEKKPNLEGLASGLPLKSQRHLDHNFWQEHGCNVSRGKEISPCPVGMCYRAT